MGPVGVEPDCEFVLLGDALIDPDEPPDAGATVKACCVPVAAANAALASTTAVIMQVPLASKVTLNPFVVQTLREDETMDTVPSLLVVTEAKKVPPAIAFAGRFETDGVLGSTLSSSGCDDRERAPVPAMLVAATLKEYVSPFTSPSTVQLVEVLVSEEGHASLASLAALVASVA